MARDVPPVHPRLLQGAAVPGRGSVIHAMHHEQDMRYYGGLRKHIPLTFWAMMAGTLAITGVGIVGLADLRASIPRTRLSRPPSPAERPIICTALPLVFAALLTSFYSWRLMFLTFFGKPRWAQSEHIQHAVHDDSDHDHDHDHGDMPRDHAHDDGTAGYHPHESPLVDAGAAWRLTLGAVFAGFVFPSALSRPRR
jgi:NADH-quinone oxidoreductase subunit L